MALIQVILCTLFVSIFLIIFISEQNTNLIKAIALNSSGFVLILSCLILLTFNCNFNDFQNNSCIFSGLDFLNFSILLGLDGISLFFFILSSFLIFLCLLFIWPENNFKTYAICLLFIELLLLLVFSVMDLFFFYIFFEAILIPMFVIIGVWGSRERKVRAVYLFFFYTLIGSLFLLIGIIYIYSIVGSLNYNYISLHKFNFMEQYFLWLAFFLSFSSKIPMFPFHIWLPEAHVEAPTVGSVLLAGILLKLGVYGFIKFNLILFTEASLYFAPFVYLLSILGIIFSSLSAIRQTDIKRIIAYSSVAHMNLVTLGIFSFNLISLEGAIIQSISHGFVAGAMFLLIGIIYNRYHSRFLDYYGGLVHFMPLYSFFLLFFTMANIALPGSSSFVGEFLILNGLFKENIFCCFFATLGVVLCGVYSLWLYNRIIFCNIKTTNIHFFADINSREFSILLPLLVLVLFMGLNPNFFFQYIHFVCSNLMLL
jgi:proton-translocating NADH-quinone oxidoreductase chain M